VLLADDGHEAVVTRPDLPKAIGRAERDLRLVRVPNGHRAALVPGEQQQPRTGRAQVERMVKYLYGHIISWEVASQSKMRFSAGSRDTSS